MQVEVKVPQLSESVSEATLVSWRKKAGEAVKRDDVSRQVRPGGEASTHGVPATTTAAVPGNPCSYRGTWTRTLALALGAVHGWV